MRINLDSKGIAGTVVSLDTRNPIARMDQGKGNQRAKDGRKEKDMRKEANQEESI